MELVAAATLYGLFSAWLLFPLFGVPRALTTSAGVLAWLDFLAALTWGYTREGCARGSCSPLAEAARSAVAVDLPALSIVVVALAVAHGVRRRRGRPRSSLPPPPSQPLPSSSLPLPPHSRPRASARHSRPNSSTGDS